MLLNALDALVRAGERARVRCRAQRAWPDALDLGVAGVALNGAVTDARGWAVAEAAADHVWAPGVVSRVFAEPPEREIVVCDVDRTISDASNLACLTTPNERIAAVPGSVEALTRLASRFLIVYVTARNVRYTAKTRAWLELRGFPRGPVIARERRFWQLPKGPYKRGVMRDLASRWTRIRAGIGDHATDAEAYASVGVVPILVGAVPRAALPPETICLSDWPAVEAVLR